MKTSNYEALHYVVFTSLLLPSLSHFQIVFCLRTLHQIT